MNSEEIRQFIEEEVSKREEAIRLRLEQEYAERYKAVRLELREIQLMNIQFNSASETVREFQNRFEGIVEDIQKSHEAELTERSLRGYLINAISEACPKIAEDALQDGSQLKVRDIFDRMFTMFGMFAGNGRREQASGWAVLGMGPKKPTNKRKATWKSSGASGSKKADITCFKCGIKGHTSAECRNEEKMCYNCGRFGHLSKSCDLPQSVYTRKVREQNRSKT